MTTTEINQPITKPISVWNKPLKADFKGLFLSLTNAALKGAAGKWPELGAELAKAATSVGITTSPGERAWLLLRQALANAIFKLTKEVVPYFSDTPGDLEALCDGLDLSFEEMDLTISKELFECPGQLPLLELIKPSLARWFQLLGLEEAQAAAVANRLPAYFVLALHDEWVENQALYQPVREVFDTPFLAAAERELAWRRYRAWLVRQVDRPMFQEGFGLRSVYVPLRAWYYKPKRSATLKVPAPQERDPDVPRVATDLATLVRRWLTRADPRDAIRVISGGPGSGKSSFARMLAAELCEEGDVQVLFVPLHLLEATDDLVDAVGEFVRSSGFLSHNPLDPEDGEAQLLLILDGLDELAMRGKQAQEVAGRFVREVLRKLDVVNTGDRPRLQVLLVGRELVIQSQQHEFRRPGQILNLLPYYIPKSQRSWTWASGKKILEEDQRTIWWRKYGCQIGRSFAEMPDGLERDDLKEVTGQPLLNYLIALSYCSGSLELSGSFNLNSVYHGLMESVWCRDWEGREYEGIRGLSLAQFERVLEEISLSAWHGGGRTTTIDEVHSRCLSSAAGRLLARFEQGAREGVSRLMTAFYFRQHGERSSGEPTFEFTHKSFGEFLTARRILRSLDRIATQFGRRDEDPDDGWAEAEALVHLAGLCGPTLLDQDLMAFLSRELMLQKVENVLVWQGNLVRLFGYLMRHSVPIERLPSRPERFCQQRDHVRNTEVAVLVLMSCCARVTRELSRVDWPDLTSLGTWLYRVQEQRDGPRGSIVLQHLDYLCAPRSVLHIHDLYRANLSHSDMDGAKFDLANMATACANGASMRGAVFMEAYLSQTDFEDADLHQAQFRRANLEGANLDGANLDGANLDGANLDGTNLEGKNLQGADYQGARLTTSILERMKADKTGPVMPPPRRRRRRHR
jgi:hypothetical protein